MSDYDYINDWTEDELQEEEKAIRAIYLALYAVLLKKVGGYMAKHEKADRAQQKRLSEGDITEQDYATWRISKYATGKGWAAMRKDIAKTANATNKVAYSQINSYTPNIFAENANFAAFDIDIKVKINTAFDLLDRSTVERLINEHPKILPYVKVKNTDIVWNMQLVESSILQGILQGKSNQEIGKWIAKIIGEKNKVNAIRAARTATTAAENAGRLYSYDRAEEMGIELEKEWLATLDGRTRHEHRKLDGQKVGIHENFKVDGYEIQYPGDPDAEPEMVFNCRCTLVSAIKGVDNSHNERTTNMMSKYEDWKEGKKVNQYPDDWSVDITKRDKLWQK